MAEYVKIYCCGDCGYYDWRKHKCSRGAKVDDGSHFFRDCPLGIHEEKDGERVDAVPVRHGRWIKKRYWSEGAGMGERYGYYYSCSKCGNLVCGGYDECGKKYCDECGARMYGKDGDQP